MVKSLLVSSKQYRILLRPHLYSRLKDSIGINRRDIL
jgi:hypothetical protein